MPRFSANLGFLWPDRPLLERIDAAANFGFKAIEAHWPYDVPPAEVRGACARRGITALGLNTIRGDVKKGEFGLGALSGREVEFAASVDQAIAYSVAAGFTAIHAMAGIVSPDQRKDAKAVFVNNIARAADKAAEHGLIVLLEPINPRDAPGYFYSTIEEAAEIVGVVGRSNLKIMFDCYHVGIAQGDILRRIERHLPLIGHVQIAAVPSRAEPDEGEIAYGAVFRALDALGYPGWVGCEYKPRASTDIGLVWMKALADPLTRSGPKGPS